MHNISCVEYQSIRSPVRIPTQHKMRSGLLFVLVVTCISAQLYTTNADVRESIESTQTLSKPRGKSMKKLREKIQAREGGNGNTY